VYLQQVLEAIFQTRYVFRRGLGVKQATSQATLAPSFPGTYRERINGGTAKESESPVLPPLPQQGLSLTLLELDGRANLRVLILLNQRCQDVLIVQGRAQGTCAVSSLCRDFSA
jgi:hypothetical protein